MSLEYQISSKYFINIKIYNKIIICCIKLYLIIIKNLYIIEFFNLIKIKYLKLNLIIEFFNLIKLIFRIFENYFD